MKIATLIIFLGAVMFAYAVEMSGNDFQTGVSIGKNILANRYQNLYFSGQPGWDEFETLKDQGFSLIVNIRTKEEYDESREKAILDKLNIKYVNVPIDINKPLTDDQVTRISEAVLEEGSDTKILIHCKSGNRVGIWVGAHFFKYMGYSKDEALKVAVQMGLTSSLALERLNEYIVRPDF